MADTKQVLGRMSGADSFRALARRLPASGAASVSLPCISVVGIRSSVVGLSPAAESW
jgi:hypothetical protein